VKARGNDDFSAPERNVDDKKREAVTRAARNYARRAGVDWERVRFDLVSVVFSDPPAISHRKDAFRPNRTL
jgi:putative endonuclease